MGAEIVARVLGYRFRMRDVVWGPSLQGSPRLDRSARRNGLSPATCGVAAEVTHGGRYQGMLTSACIPGIARLRERGGIDWSAPCAHPPNALRRPAVAAYKSLAHAERAFRNLKSVELEVHPIYHYREVRVRAHLFLCMLAAYVGWQERALAPLLCRDEAPLERSDAVAPADPLTGRGRRPTCELAGDPAAASRHAQRDPHRTPWGARGAELHPTQG
jgi:hypothetical protein